MVWRSTYRRGGKFYLKTISLCCRTQAAGLHKMPKLEVLEAVCPWVFAVPFADRFQFCGLHGLQQLSTRPSWAEILCRTLRVCQCHGLRASVWGQMDPYPLSSTISSFYPAILWGCLFCRVLTFRTTSSKVSKLRGKRWPDQSFSLPEWQFHSISRKSGLSELGK
jgi:hypothetical protein